MKIDRNKKRLRVHAEDGGSIEFDYANMGEPYREGMTATLDDGQHFIHLFFEQYEVVQLRDLLNELYPK